MSKFMDNAQAKVSKLQGYLMGKGNCYRDFSGYLHTRNRILQTASNYSNMTQYSEPLQAIFRGFSENRNFSEGPGLNAVANTTGIDVVDISILTSVKSFLPFLAVDRGMSKPTDLATYQELVAVNSAGGLSAGDVAVSPFKPINRNLNLSRSGAKITSETMATTETTVSVAFPIAKGGVKASFTSGSDTIVGEDIKGDGTIYWNGAGVALTINYGAGTITAAAAPASEISFEITPDTTSDSTGGTTLKLRPQTKDIKISAEPNRVILETSMEQIAYMNSLLGNGIGNAKEFGNIALQQILNAFVYWINADLVDATWAAAVQKVPLSATERQFDMSAYYAATGFDKFSNTKDDKMNQFIYEVNGDLLTQSNMGVTYYLVGMMGGNLLANSSKFVPSSVLNQQINGVIGSYNGIPVLRHDSITGIDANTALTAAGEANLIAGHRDISGAAAPVMYGEYLPLYSTKNAVNFNNPTELSQAMFNMSKSDVLVDNLITRATIKYS